MLEVLLSTEIIHTTIIIDTELETKWQQPIMVSVCIIWACDGFSDATNTDGL